jgi:hypothetical protein
MNSVERNPGLKIKNFEVEKNLPSKWVEKSKHIYRISD